MHKTILVTGATDGIGLVTIKRLLEEGHFVLVHGRSEQKLQDLNAQLKEEFPTQAWQCVRADLSNLNEVKKLADTLKEHCNSLDVLINNAGVYAKPVSPASDGLDARFVVNTIAPYLLTHLLRPMMSAQSRVINVASAAQAPLDPQELAHISGASDGEVYAKSKLALIMWSRFIAHQFDNQSKQSGNQPSVISVNPKSLLGSKMVKQAYGIQGGDLRVGADILCRAALSDEFADASGRYYDNDAQRFCEPHPAGQNLAQCEQLALVLDKIIQPYMR